MKFAVVECGGDWIVQCDSVEVARFSEQPDALRDVTERLRELRGAGQRVSLAMCYETTTE